MRSAALKIGSTWTWREAAHKTARMAARAAAACMNLSVTQWTASTAFMVGQHITDSNGDIEIVTAAGTSKSGTHPIWAAAGGTTADGGVSWFNQGLALSFTSWTAGSTIATNTIILDQNNFIQEVTSTGGVSTSFWRHDSDMGRGDHRLNNYRWQPHLDESRRRGIFHDRRSWRLEWIHH